MIDNGIAGPDVRWYACALTIFAGVSMVSNVLFYSGKEINLRRSVPFIVIIAFVLGFLLVSSYPPGVLFGLFLCYAVSGYVLGLWNWLKGRKRRSAASPPEGDFSRRSPRSWPPSLHSVCSRLIERRGAASSNTQNPAGAHHERPVDHLRHHLARRRAEPRRSMTRDEKLRIARQLERMRST
jgi:hypothetical protein